MNSVKEYAYAKINLYLDVTSKREDGFHDVKTVMHTVSLSDEITVSVKPSSKREVKLSSVGNSKLPTDSRNLAYRAAELFLDSTLINAEVFIKLNKRIPVAAGLAGGSTDAAAVLRALNRLFKKPLTEKRMLDLASELGSDVPFCLIGGTAVCHGRGEKVERLPENLKLHVVVAVGDEHVSTPSAYSALDEMYNDFKDARTDDPESDFTALMSAVDSGDLNGLKLYNIFENAIFPSCSKAESIKHKLLELGAQHALMSGSGPSVFGIFENELMAKNAKDELLNEGFSAFLTHTV